MDEQPPELTPKAQQTRQRILDTALNLFITQGYDATTMREIAQAADCSLGLAYRYFDRKEAFVLALYERMARQTAELIDELPPFSFGERFFLVMTDRLALAADYREALGALFGTTLNPASGVNLLGQSAGDARDVAQEAFLTLVTEAADAPPPEDQADLALILYSAHFGILLFWLFDRTPDQRATTDLVGFIRDVMVLANRLESVPLVSSMVRPLMTRLATIMAGVFT